MSSTDVKTIIPAPAGYVVDFANPQTQYIAQSYTVVAVEMTLAFIFLLQRLYTKIVIMKKFQLEDAVVIVAWVLCMATQICLLLGIAHGAVGRHAWEISIEKYGYYSRIILAAPLLYAMGTAAAKCSLALFYSRLNPNKIFQAFVWSTLAVTLSAYISIFFSLLFACKPIAASWDPLLLPIAVCINRGGIYIAQAVIGIVTDVLLLALPIPTVLKLQMPTKQKFGLVGIFAVGSITIVTSIVRLIILLPSLTTADQTWVIGEGCLWIFIEANLLIMCCCLSTLRRFFKHFAPRLIGETSSTGNSKSRSRGFSNNARQHTFGSGGAKRTLDSFMNTNNDAKPIALTSFDDLDKGGANAAAHAKSLGKDTDSEEAILYERSVQVTYETAGQNGRSSAQAHQPEVWSGRRF
ncbi:hypothetical protein HBI38_042840 [Parastagonospora nodorum]|nr:hypothetical protein HBI03_055130 [Parastagonospora nodorum]KAH4278822.1 hypothetical protein HBI04_070570 [Parastagonospora nodorum]KAH5090163.1 hypothetical protein HBI73_128070 [Parastagonospora nodorum]KAH5326857.1 hypothetical protein HBI50_087840 [Parastagonospora nodorum]KAH6277644.1 hypothetical protein HBI41_053340 [Parastagonospora nodorum]